MLSLLNLLAVLSLLALVAVGIALLTSASLMREDPLRWPKLGAFLGVLLVGWIFVLWTNKFHVTAPVVMVCLGYLAIVTTVMNLWRTGAAVVAPVSDDDAWGRPVGAHGELEKEKKTLLKAIKEAEFDHAMGKLSKADSDSLIRQYRARAIEVIKELDRLEAGTALSPKEQIAREVKARIELAASDKPSNRAKNVMAAKAAKAEKAKADDKAAAKAEPEESTAKAAKLAKDEASEAKAEAKASDARADDKAAAKAEPEESTAKAARLAKDEASLAKASDAKAEDKAEAKADDNKAESDGSTAKDTKAEDSAGKADETATAAAAATDGDKPATATEASR